jgi:AraC-like DNA-binding protein
MLLKYNFEPCLVKRVLFVSHKGKKRGMHTLPDKHPEGLHEIIFVDYGRIRLTLEKHTLIVNPGECIFLPGGTVHSFEGVDEAPFDYLNIMYYGKLPDYMAGRIIPVNRKCFDILNKLKEESAHNQAYCKEVMASCLTELIANLARQVKAPLQIKIQESPSFKKYQSEYVNRALMIIAKEYAKPLNMKMLSKSVGIGKDRLRQLLRLEVGKTFKMILHMQRIAAAKHLIAEGKYSLDNISTAVGYSYPYFFYRIFKRLTGMTPGAYAVSLGEPQVKA